MTDLNSVSLVGRITKTPDLVKRGAAGTSVLTFTIAVNRNKKKRDSDEWEEYASFFDCTTFGTRAENIQKWLTKGTVVSIKGYIEQERWEDSDGKKYSKVKIVLEEINPFVAGKSKSKDDASKNSSNEQNYEDYSNYSNEESSDFEDSLI